MNAKYLAIVMALTLAALALGPSAVAFEPSTPGVISISAEPGTSAELQAYWTPNRLAAARPLMMPAATGLPTQEADEPLGEPGFAPGGLPNPRAAAEAMRALPDVWGVEAAEAEMIDGLEATSLEPTGTSGIYTSYYGNKFTQFWKAFPYKAVGKLYFSDWLGNDYYCSASVISANDIAVTAAHCAYDTAVNRWYDNWLFVPAERNYAGPYGTFGWDNVWILTAYGNSPSWAAGIRYDVAVVELAIGSLGHDVSYYTGWLGRSWELGYVQNITEIGYPANRPSGDKYTYINHAETYAGTTDILWWGSNLGSGVSGSPVLRVYAPFQSGANNYVNAVHSGGSPNATSPINGLGPRFSNNNIVPLCNAVGC